MAIKIIMKRSRKIPKSKFDNQETHQCPRCNAFLIHERFYSMGERGWVWRCIKCGEIIDDVVLYNRRLLKKVAKSSVDAMTLLR
jgi:ribosomal protein L37AE/L43A